MTSSDDDPYKLMDTEWLKSELAAGHPIMVIWNSFGGHGQVIIGYDDMGTEGTNDDVLIMMDPYDTTDHNADGYTIQSYERLVYGINAEDGEAKYTKFLSAYPEGWSYTPVKGSGMALDLANIGNFTDDNKLSYGKTAEDILKFYPDTKYIGENGLAGAATGGYERSGDIDNSPYYKLLDFYNMKDTDTLKILENYKTIQQSTEWTCGCTSALMTIEHFGKNEGEETDVSLASHRQEGKTGATMRFGMKEIFDYMNTTYNQDWVTFSTDDLTDADGNKEIDGEENYIGKYCLQYDLIPYLLDHGIPMMIGWDEWGGHWQTIIGYDNMGTEGTQDDVLILADSYDTTDHNQDGYTIESFERLVYGWNSNFETANKENDFIVAFPKEGHEDVIADLGLAD